MILGIVILCNFRYLLIYSLKIISKFFYIFTHLLLFTHIKNKILIMIFYQKSFHTKVQLFQSLIKYNENSILNLYIPNTIALSFFRNIYIRIFNNIMRSMFCFHIYFSNIFSNNTHTKQLNSTNKNNNTNQRCPTIYRIIKN